MPTGVHGNHKGATPVPRIAVAYQAAGRDPHPERQRDWYRRSHGVPRDRYLKRGRQLKEEAS